MSIGRGLFYFGRRKGSIMTMTAALILFLATYVLLLILPNHRAYVALLSGVIFIVSGILPVEDALAAIDLNVLMMIAGTMGLVSLFIESGMPALMADVLLDHMRNVRATVIALSLFAGIVSAFVDNVATVLMIAPVAMSIAKKFDISPVPMIIAISVSSNLQGAATLVGDTTSILLGGYANMDFLDFFWFRGKPGMFFVVEIGALLTVLVLLWLFRHDKQPTMAKEHTVVTDYLPTVLLAAMVLLLIGVSFFPGRPSITNGVICMGMFLIGFAANVIKKRSMDAFLKPLKELDYATLLLLAGLFVVIGGISKAGVIDAIAALFRRIGGGNLFLIYTLIVWASVLFSAFIDNIPYVATMLPVVQQMSLTMGVEPSLLYFGLLTGATLGGNLTPIGASANITSIGLLRKEGYEVKTKDFMRIGVPLSLTAVITGYLLVWVLWH